MSHESGCNCSRCWGEQELCQLPSGRGCKYLEVIRGEGNNFVAKQWRRKTGRVGIFIHFM